MRCRKIIKLLIYESSFTTKGCPYWFYEAFTFLTSFFLILFANLNVFIRNRRPEFGIGRVTCLCWGHLKFLVKSVCDVLGNKVGNVEQRSKYQLSWAIHVAMCIVSWLWDLKNEVMNVGKTQRKMNIFWCSEVMTTRLSRTRLVFVFSHLRRGSKS